MASSSTHTTGIDPRGPEGLRAAPRPGVGARARGWLVHSHRLHFIVMAVLVVLLALALLGWALAGRQAAHQQRALEERNALAQAQMATSARQALEAQTRKLLLLSAQPLAWAMRAELLAGDRADVDAYVEQLVRDLGVVGVTVVDASGKVLSASNLDERGRDAATVLPALDLTASEPRVVEASGLLRTVVPIMGYDSRLGTLVLDYSSSDFAAAGLAPAAVR
jgi:type II secretory pathway pseudopilin PulG